MVPAWRSDDLQFALSTGKLCALKGGKPLTIGQSLSCCLRGEYLAGPCHHLFTGAVQVVFVLMMAQEHKIHSTYLVWR